MVTLITIILILIGLLLVLDIIVGTINIIWSQRNIKYTQKKTNEIIDINEKYYESIIESRKGGR